MHAFDIEEVSRTGAACDVTSSLVPVPPCGSFVPATLPWSPFCGEIGANWLKKYSQDQGPTGRGFLLRDGTGRVLAKKFGYRDGSGRVVRKF